MRRKELLHRLIQMVVTLLGVSLLTFSLMYLSPGDPVMMLLEVGDTIVSEETIAETRAQLGLDQPFHVQYVRWLTGVLQGDLGLSYSAKMPVVDRLWQGLPGTVALAGASIVLMLVISVPCGILAAMYRNRTVDNLIRGLSF
ncbi:MAG: ABC transporter permease, partial [Sporomusa sp.]